MRLFKTQRKKRRFSVLRLLLQGGLLFVCATLLPVLLLRFVPPPASAFMLARHVERWTAESPPKQPLRYQWVAWERISPQLALAVIAAEDQLFLEHWGFDFEAISKAAQHNRHKKRIRGGSTISQQLAKNLFLWAERSYLRKGLEAWFTLLIELCWSKQRILEVYLNVVEFGPDTYGAQAAAERHFGTSAARLSRHQAALLAAVLPNPKRMNAGNPSSYVLGRTFHIAEAMEQLGGTALIRGIP